MNCCDAICLAAGLIVTAAICGCGQSSAALEEDSIDGTRFLLTEQPADTVSVCDLRESLPHGQPVAVLGRIGGVDNPWTEGEASFLISDLSLAAPAEDVHECGDRCSLCEQRHADQLNTMAFVQIVDDQGHVIRTDARRLLGVAEDQAVVVFGRASLNRTGHMVIAATGLYVRD